MRWDELDLDNAVWTIPAERSKSKRAHDVPLSAWAVEIIAALPKIDVEYVFAARRSKGAASGFSNAKRRLDAASGVTGWRLHDLRRVVATGLAKRNVAIHVVSRLLNHSSSKLMGVTAVYARYDYFDERRHALDDWAAHLRRVIEGVGDEKVVPLHG